MSLLRRPEHLPSVHMREHYAPHAGSGIIGGKAFPPQNTFLVVSKIKIIQTT